MSQTLKTVATPAARLLVAASLLLWLGIALIPSPRPDPLPANAPATEFSAVRAMEQVRAISQQPHPVRSVEHDRVRDYIRAEFERLGLKTELQSGFVEFAGRRGRVSADVDNIVARLPGTANTRPVMLVAHYDCAPESFGASDDGHAVAVLLETLRALRAAGSLRNDVVFLITDGEELGLLGAQLFMREHPWRNQPGITLNFEARGTSGPAHMFETSDGNGWMIRGLRAAAPRANATSVAYEIYRRMPNGTDLTVFKRGGLAGMNFAFIGTPEYYHTAGDNLEHLDPVSVQEQGGYAIALTRWFGGQDLSLHPDGNAIYFPTLLTPLIVYPASWAKPLALATLLGLLVVLAAGLRRRARGVWLGIPLLAIAALQLWVIGLAPGASYLLEWPLLGAVAAFGILVLAPRELKLNGGVVAMAFCAAPAFLLVVPMLSGVVTAFTLRGAIPVLAAAALLVLLCVLPQLTLLLRRSA